MHEDHGSIDGVEYQTHTLPQYVYAHFGGKAPTLIKIGDRAWKFTGGGTEVVVNAETAGDARRRIKKVIQNVNEMNGVKPDRRVTRHLH